MDRFEATFVASADAPREARAFLRNALATQNRDGFGEVAELLTTELVANVVRHVGSDATVRVIPARKGIRVEVDDTSTREPVVQSPDPSTPSGRGLLLIDGYASCWGCEVRRDGKTVWFEIVDVTTATRDVQSVVPRLPPSEDEEEQSDDGEHDEDDDQDSQASLLPDPSPTSTEAMT